MSDARETAILPTVGLTHRRTSFKLLMKLDSFAIVTSWAVCSQSSTGKKRGTHLADAFDSFKQCAGSRASLIFQKRFPDVVSSSQRPCIASIFKH